MAVDDLRARLGLAGSLVIVSMQNDLATLGAWLAVILGVIFVVCVLAFRQGLVGVAAKRIGPPL